MRTVIPDTSPLKGQVGCGGFALFSLLVLQACGGPSSNQGFEQALARASNRKPNVELRVLVRGELTAGGKSVPLDYGESVQLKVELVRSDGSVIDVTGGRHTVYGTGVGLFPNEAELSVSSTGLVRAPSRGLAPSAGMFGYANVGVIYDDGSELGGTSLSFEVADRSRPGLYASAPKTTLGLGETTRLSVWERMRDGSLRDLTGPDSGTTYFTTSESHLVVEPDGHVTCVGTRGKAQESAIIGVANGELSAEVSFACLQAGPGPALEVVAEKSVLRESESTLVHVFRRGDTTADLAPTLAGTHYVVFSGSGRPDANLLSMTGDGQITAPKSIGRFTRIQAIVFARNGKDVGWTIILITPPKPDNRYTRALAAIHSVLDGINALRYSQDPDRIALAIERLRQATGLSMTPEQWQSWLAERRDYLYLSAVDGRVYADEAAMRERHTVRPYREGPR